MRTLSDSISNYRQSSTNELLYGEGYVISSTLINAVKTDTELFQYRDWNNNFQENYNKMKEIDVNRIQKYQIQYNEISDKFHGETSQIASSDEYKGLVSNIRNNTVSRRWQYEKFFLNKSDIELNNKVLGVVEYDSKVNFFNRDHKIVRYWSEDEIDMIKNGDVPKVNADQAVKDLNSVEGSHGKAVNAYDVGDIKGMADADNIQPQSPKYHRMVFHEGDTHTSGEEFNDISEKKILIQNNQREIVNRDVNEDYNTALIIGLAVGSITAILELRRISYEQTEWNRRKLARIGISFVKGASVGTVPLLVINTIDGPVRNLIDNTIREAFGIEGALPLNGLIENISDSLGDFLVISTTLAVGKLVRNSVNGNYINLKQGAKEFVSDMKKPITEQAGFFMIDLILDNLTPIPDPALNALVTSMRIAYSLSKIGFNMKHQKDLQNYKFDILYEAGASLALGYK